METSKLLLNKGVTSVSFDLNRLLKTVFDPKKQEKLAILIDLKTPESIINLEFLKAREYTVQKKAYDYFYKELKNKLLNQLELGAVDLFAYEITAGNNCELPSKVVSVDGKHLDLQNIYSNYDIILCISSFSATAPLAVAAKEYGFRGATIVSLNEIVLNSGLAVDYSLLSRQTENFRLAMNETDSADIHFEVEGKNYHLHLYLGDQVAQKNDGICHKKGEVVNLPAGKVYFIPFDAEGDFPMKFEDGTLASVQVSKGRLKKIHLISGSQKTIDALQKKIDCDKAASIISELGFGTQDLPFSENYVQDAKVFGTFHLGIGRNDHLHGSVTLSRFIEKKNASHEDILFSHKKTPEIFIKEFTIKRKDKIESIIKNDEPGEYLLSLNAKSETIDIN